MGVSQIVEEFISLCAVRGHEEDYIRCLGERLSHFGETEIRRLFSVCRFHAAETGKKKILVVGYVSTPGFLASEIKENGYVKMEPIDGIGNRNPLTWIEPFVPVDAETFSKRVTLYGERAIDAVVPAPPVHYQTSVGKLAKADGLYAVTGYTKQELEQFLRPGDAITYTPYLQRALNRNFFAPFLEQRIVAAVLVFLAEQMTKADLNFDVSVAVTGGSDFSGAVQAVELERPDEVIVVSTTTEQSYKNAGVAPSDGILQCFGSAVNYGYSQELEQYFKNNGFRHDRVASLVHTDTPADQCCYLERGIPTAMFAIPVKYTRTSVSMVNEANAEYLATALAKYFSGKGV